MIERLSTSRIHYGNRQLRMSRQNDLSRRLLLDDTCHAWMHFCLKFLVRRLEGSICVQIKIIIINCIMVAFCCNRMICIKAMIWLFNDCLVSVSLVLFTKEIPLIAISAQAHILSKHHWGILDLDIKQSFTNTLLKDLANSLKKTLKSIQNHKKNVS